MNKVQQRASLDEKSVQAVAKGTTVPRTRRSRTPVQPVEHLKVNRKVWAAAQKIVRDKRNYYTHIEIRTDREVIVR